ncbi:MAG: hypothetical protein KA009_02455 [Rhodoluna sp.]|nr:hypothetical protein [Rhodoluna sp.]
MSLKRLALGIAIVLAMVGSLTLIAGLLAPRPLIALGSQTQSKESLAARGFTTSSDSKMAMMPYIFEYVAGPELSDVGGQGKVYELKLEGSPEQVLQRAGKAFGLTGEVKKSAYWSAENPSYFIGSEDGTSPSVSIWWNGTGSWFYSNNPPMSEQPCLRTDKAEDGSEYCAEYPVLLPTPELIPSRSEVLAEAQRIFAATGLKISADEIAVYRDEWSASASASQKVAGQETAITWSMGYDSKGNLSWASGNSVTAVERGEFQTISAKNAVKRLSDWRWYGSPPNSAYPPMEATNRSSTLDLPAVSPGEIETVVITINGSTNHLLQIWDKSGASWLVPGYGLKGSNGSVNFAVSLIEGVIELPEPVAIEPGMPEPLVDPMTK